MKENARGWHGRCHSIWKAAAWLLCEGMNASMVYMAEDRATYKQGVDVMIRQACADVLMDMLLNIVLKQVIHVKWVLVEAFLRRYFAKKAMVCDAPMSEHLDMCPQGIWYAKEQEKLEIRVGCFMFFIFDMGANEMPKYVSDWATTLWLFDPGGRKLLAMCCC